ncbi:TetR/AcrR family transcriptional regulator [Promicromonospora sp. NPDC057138]|uniref:TetR/AcrR family transcriptional regulator n=1 Tax=Promicromonospora sp. NPDC057138 TaxID=3346031 RepID=UPI00363E8AD0
MTATPRTRPAKPPLSRDSIVAAALELVDQLGSDAVTMRRVADAVDTAPASLYVYVSDRQELMALAHDLAVADVDLPTSADGDWRARLELLVLRATDALAAHRDLATVGRAQLTTGPSSLRIVEEILRLLRDGGLADEACAWAIDLFGQHIASSALEASAPAGLDDFHSTLSGEDYPTIRALGPLLTSGDAASRAAWKLRVLVDGVLAQAKVTPRSR